MTLQELCTITARTAIGAEYVLLTLAAPRIGPRARPGQFVHVLTDPAGELLRRPFSIQDVRQSPSGEWELELLFQVIGEGTRLLAGYGIGESLDCLGPQGHPWPIATEAGSAVALIGGGVGVPPLVFLAKELRERGIRAHFYQGARTADLLLMTDRIRELGAELQLATNDGSSGHHGFVTELLPPFAEAPFEAVYACGPLPMLQAIARWSGSLIPGDTAPRIPVWLSFENKMGCAVGACLGCVIPMRTGGYDRVCTEGPIFRAESVNFQQLTAL